jgi:hypothetical protein
MLVDMMPDMMRQADMASLIAATAPEVGKRVSLYGLVVVILALANDDELVQEVKDQLPGLMDSVHEMMPVMMPMMASLMHQMMPTMMGMMAPMMADGPPEMCREMPERMAEAMQDNPAMARAMPMMMSEMCPRMIEKIAPQLSAEQRVAFARDLIAAVFDGDGARLNEAHRSALFEGLGDPSGEALETT